jgi:hypothetical protein
MPWSKSNEERIMTGNIKVTLEHRGALTLRPGDYLATGGEGSVYQAKGTVVKIFTDPAKMARDGMQDKIGLLKALKHPYVVAPEGLVHNEKGSAVGYYMPYAPGEPLARMFTNAFWIREGFDMQGAKTLAARMRDTVLHAHTHQAVMADANELNWIVASGSKNPEPRAIDVDSWAIGRFGAKVVMPSIRDWHATSFTEKTDWFAWAVVTFQLFAGIHPYRGTLVGYRPTELEARMKANASVFRPGVGLNRAVRDFAYIPAPLLDWYQAVFEQGERAIPPSPTAAGAPIPVPARTYRQVAGPAGTLIFEKLLDYANDQVLRVFPCGVAQARSGTLIDVATKQQLGVLASLHGEVVKTPGGWLIADWVDGEAKYAFVESGSRATTPLMCGIIGRAYFRFENRLFLVTDDALIELSLMEVGRPLLVLGTRTPILLPKATHWFDGVGIQEAMGATFMVLPFGEKACATVRVRELDGETPVAAKAGNRYVVVITLDKKGNYHTHSFFFTHDYATYVPHAADADGPDLNVAMLPRGVCAAIPEDGKLWITVPSNGQSNLVEDTHITSDFVLANWADTLVYIHDGAVWKVRMK